MGHRRSLLEVTIFGTAKRALNDGPPKQHEIHKTICSETTSAGAGAHAKILHKNV